MERGARSAENITRKTKGAGEGETENVKQVERTQPRKSERKTKYSKRRKDELDKKVKECQETERNTGKESKQVSLGENTTKASLEKKIEVRKTKLKKLNTKL